VNTGRRTDGAMDKRIPRAQVVSQICSSPHDTKRTSRSPNALARIDQRLARSILMISDRTGLETLPLTHEFLSLVLGVRGAGVTEALQGRK
jgi:hypothetical protein